MSLAYADFLARKSVTAPASGIDTPGDLPAALKPFQRDIVRWALRRGRAALFEGTGLGKTIQELAWAQAVSHHAQGPVLILTPLAVAQQTCAEAAKFGIPGVAYASDPAAIVSPIVVTNYDRLDRFDPRDFAGIVLDESSIIKAHDSATRAALIEGCKGVPFKLCGTATPAPNDYTELGNHAEFLDVMSEKEMLAMFFVHDGSVRASGGSEWRLKGHAERDFWAWLASWSVMIRHPADLGYDDPGYDLPPLRRHQITVAASHKPTAGMLFPVQARTLAERIGARRDTLDERVAAAAKIVNAQPDRPWLLWCNLNAEADALVRAIPGAQQVRGSDDRDLKASRLLGFVTGEPRVLISKPSIAGFGLNYQHCADMVFVGLNDSFEQLFQAMRRCWRFGQRREVNAYLVASDIEGAVVSNLERKEQDHERMASAMVGHMKDLSAKTIRGGRVSVSTYNAAKRMEVPAWLRHS